MNSMQLFVNIVTFLIKIDLFKYDYMSFFKKASKKM